MLAPFPLRLCETVEYVRFQIRPHKEATKTQKPMHDLANRSTSSHLLFKMITNSQTVFAHCKIEQSPAAGVESSLFVNP